MQIYIDKVAGRYEVNALFPKDGKLESTHSNVDSIEQVLRVISAIDKRCQVVNEFTNDGTAD